MGQSKNLALLAQYPARARMWWNVRRTRHVLLSFPKCGRTWLRHMLAVYQDPTSSPHLDFSLTSGNVFHRTLITHGGTDFVGLRGFLPKEKLERNIRAMAGKNVLLLIRDPRDVVVSFYHEATSRHPRGTDRVFTMGEFIRHEGYGIRYIVDFMRMAHDHRAVFRSYLLLRYEDLKTDPVTNLGHAVRFLSRQPAMAGGVTERLSIAVEASNFETMKKREASGKYGTSILRPGNFANPDSFKVRQGTVGGYRTTLSQPDCDYLNTHMARLPAEFGYL